MNAKFIASLVLVSLVFASVAAAGSGVILKVDASSRSGAYLGLGEFLYKAGMGDSAESAYLKSISLEDSALARHNLGIIYSDLGLYAEAEEQFRAAVLLDPDYAMARKSLAVLLFESGRFRDATDSFRAQAQLEESAQAYFDLGVALVKSVMAESGTIEDLLEARSSFAAAERISPGYPHAASNQAAVEGLIGSLGRQ